MEEDLLALETRRRLYEVVRSRPGVGGREIQRSAGTGWGETVYHLDRLCAAGVLQRERAEHQDHYFVATVPGGDRSLLRFLRSPSARQLLLVLLEHPGSTVAELGAGSGLSPGRVAVHLQRLIRSSILVTGRRGRFRTFSVADRDRALRLLLLYREGFADRWVERVVETWSELLRR